MFCPNCGTENPETSSFCSKCGEKINGSTSELLKTKKQTKQILAIIYSFIAGVFTVVVFLNLARQGSLLTTVIFSLADGIFIFMAVWYTADRTL